MRFGACSCRVCEVGRRGRPRHPSGRTSQGIEEADPAAAVLEAGDRLFLFYAAGSLWTLRACASVA